MNTLEAHELVAAVEEFIEMADEFARRHGRDTRGFGQAGILAYERLMQLRKVDPTAADALEQRLRQRAVNEEPPEASEPVNDEPVNIEPINDEPVNIEPVNDEPLTDAEG